MSDLMVLDGERLAEDGTEEYTTLLAAACENWPSNVGELPASSYRTDSKKFWWSDDLNTLLDAHAPKNSYVASLSYYGVDFVRIMLEERGMEHRVVPIPGSLYGFSVDDVKNPKAEFGVTQAMIEFPWRGAYFQVLSTPMGHSHLNLLFAPSMLALQQASQMILSFRQKTEGTVIMYNGGVNYSRRVRKQLRRFTWDDVILPETMIQEIRGTVEDFFDPKNRTVYDLLNVPYKRGGLFGGAPGCGKSLVGKVLANTVDLPFIYVTSVEVPEKGKKVGIQEVWEMAEDYAPCQLFFEDLDSQLDENCRTDFLNAMDGFKSSEGVLCWATTNHPERIDAALTDRPSRFDRKWTFKPLPTELRYKYLINRLQRILEKPHLGEDIHQILQRCARETQGHQPAYLQELVVSASVAWVASNRMTHMYEELAKALEIVKDQSQRGSGDKLAAEMQEGAVPKIGLRAGGPDADLDLDALIEEFEQDGVAKRAPERAAVHA